MSVWQAFQRGDFSALSGPRKPWSLECGCTECVETLVNVRADVCGQYVMNEGHPPVRDAAKAGMLEALRGAAKAAARGLEIREKGYTPLAVALRYNKKECVEVLMDAGAQLSSLPLDVRIPEWALDYFDEVTDRVNACKKSLIVLLGLIRRKCPPFTSKDAGGSSKKIIDWVWETRRNRVWGPPTNAK